MCPSGSATFLRTLVPIVGLFSFLSFWRIGYSLISLPLAGKKGLLQAIVLIVEEPYLISALVMIMLNLCIADEFPEEGSSSTEERKREWNGPIPLAGGPSGTSHHATSSSSVEREREIEDA